ncbi:MAG: MFS transporter [Chitinophagaceae bacterium]|nr:MFS transporter [Chitinophagaceae bacterium]
MDLLRDAGAENESLESTVKEPPVRKTLIFTIVAIALLMTTVDATIVATALHTLQTELHTTVNWVGWTLTAYAFGFVLMLPISGKISELYGQRRVFLWSVAIFTFVSLCCGLSNNIYLLISLRVIQAIGGAGITPSATGIIVNHFGKSRDRAVSLFGSVFPVGAMIGPIFGGIFVTYMSWREIFFVNIPLGIVVILMAFKYIPRDHQPKKRPHTKPDGKGILLMGVGILSFMFAASYLGGKNVKLLSPGLITLLLISVISLTGFFRHINRTIHPIITPRLIYGKGFGPVNLINVLSGGITQGVIGLVPLYAINRYGVTALDSGLLLVAEGIAAIVFSVIVTILLRRTGYRPPLYVGCTIISIGVILLAIHPFDGLSPFFWMAMSTFFIGAGAGIINPPCRNAGLQLAPEHSSTIAALRSMSLQVGAIITIAIATAIISESSNPGITQAWVYIGAAVIYFSALPLISKIPEHHGSW